MSKQQEKQIQESINDIVLSNMERFNAHLALDNSDWDSVKKLRSCSATVYTDSEYYVLRSYNTIIAIIERETDTLYDFLRYVYGYTSTSAQHVRKFEKDYGTDRWGCHHVYTWRDC